MADTAITTVAQSKTLGTDVKAGVGTAIVAAEVSVITPTGPVEEMVILAWNTYAGAKTITIKAGAGVASGNKGQGDLVLTLATTGGAQLLPRLESARFQQANGTIRIAHEAGSTGFILPIQLKRA